MWLPLAAISKNYGRSWGSTTISTTLSCFCNTSRCIITFWMISFGISGMVMPVNGCSDLHRCLVAHSSLLVFLLYLYSVLGIKIYDEISTWYKYQKPLECNTVDVTFLSCYHSSTLVLRFVCGINGTPKIDGVRNKTWVGRVAVDEIPKIGGGGEVGIPKKIIWNSKI